LDIPHINKPENLLLSYFFLLAGFLFEFLLLRTIINLKYRDVKLIDVIIASSITIFGKYIPGKIWSVVGRAGYLSARYNINLKNLSIISLYEQLFFLATGIFVSCFTVFFTFELSAISKILLLSGILSPILLISNKLIYFIFKLFRKEYPQVYISFQKKIILFLISSAVWINWAFAFYLYSAALTNEKVSILIALGYPISIAFGTLSIISPGGLGVREAVLFSYLTKYGLSSVLANTISITARIWFLFVEIFIFIIGYILKIFVKNAPRINKENN
jgi:hypothetical protein